MTLIGRRALLGATVAAVWPGKRRCRHMSMKPDQEGVFFQVIVIGTAGGVFVYNSSGQLIASVSAQANVDPLTHSNQPGIIDYNPGVSIAGLFSGALDLNSLNGSTTILSNSGGGVRLIDSLTASAKPAVSLFAPSTTLSGFAAAVTAYGRSHDGTALEQVLIDNNGVGSHTSHTSALLEVQGNLAVGPALGNIREWYAPSGGDDFAALNTALSSYGSADLLPGAYSLSAQLSVTGAALQGCDMATAIQPFGGYAGALLSCGSQGSIRNLGIQNGGADAILVPGGAAEWWLEDLFFSGNAGSCINATITGPTHGRIRGIRGGRVGLSNGGGIRLNGGTGAAVVAEVNLHDIDIQQCSVSEALFCSAVDDIRCTGPFNASVKAGVVSPVVTVQGDSHSVDLGSIDIGSGSGAGILVIQDDGGHSPTNITAGPGICQQNGAGVGVLVSGGAARIWLNRIMAQNNWTDGFQWSGTGAFNTLTSCAGNLNNQSAGVAYDVNVTSTTHLFMEGFMGVSGGVTASRNITLAGNHVTSVNEPAANTNAGNAPAGW